MEAHLLAGVLIGRRVVSSASTVWLDNDLFYLLTALAAAWVVAISFVSAMHRLHSGKPLFRPEFHRPLFLETWRSGRSLRSVITRLGGARNCLWIAVEDGTLRVGPHFPFNLTYLPEFYGLEHTVPGRAVRSVEPSRGLLTSHRIVIRYERPTGGEESFEVHVRDPDAFLRAMETIWRADQTTTTSGQPGRFP